MLRPESSFTPKTLPAHNLKPKQAFSGFRSLQHSKSERGGTGRLAKSQKALTERPLNINSSSLKTLNPAMYTRALNTSPFYCNQLTVINEEEELFPDNCLTVFDNSGMR